MAETTSFSNSMASRRIQDTTIRRDRLSPSPEASTNQAHSTQGQAAIRARRHFHELHFTKYVDKASPTLRQYCAIGHSHRSPATISCNKLAGDTKVAYLKITTDTTSWSYIDPVERLGWQHRAYSGVVLIEFCRDRV